MTGTFLLTVVDTLSILFMGDVMQHRQQIHSALIPGTDSMQSSSYDYSSYFTRAPTTTSATGAAVDWCHHWTNMKR